MLDLITLVISLAEMPLQRMQPAVMKWSFSVWWIRTFHRSWGFWQLFDNKMTTSEHVQVSLKGTGNRDSCAFMTPLLKVQLKVICKDCTWKKWRNFFWLQASGTFSFEQWLGTCAIGLKWCTAGCYKRKQMMIWVPAAESSYFLIDVLQPMLSFTCDKSNTLYSEFLIYFDAYFDFDGRIVWIS